METSALALEAPIEADPWWFRGRRRLLGSLIRELGLASAPRVLEVGCGAGANRRVLRPGGTARLIVPAFPCPWGLQDEISHHRRRYTRAPFLEILRQGGVEVGRRPPAS